MGYQIPIYDRISSVDLVAGSVLDHAFLLFIIFGVSALNSYVFNPLACNFCFKLELHASNQIKDVPHRFRKMKSMLEFNLPWLRSVMKVDHLLPEYILFSRKICLNQMRSDFWMKWGISELTVMKAVNCNLLEFWSQNLKDLASSDGVVVGDCFSELWFRKLEAISLLSNLQELS